MDDWVLRLPWSAEHATTKPDELLTREWLVSNGLGGYASGTLSGVASRRYHGLLIAALPAPLGRQVMLNHLSEFVRGPDGKVHILGGQEKTGNVLEIPGTSHLVEFRLEQGLPVWQIGRAHV
jgi:glycogen debranching enzyme